MNDSNIEQKPKGKSSTSPKQKVSTNGILAFTFGFLGISIVGLSNYLRDLQTNEFNWFYFSQLLIFLIFLLRYLLGNLAYLFNVATKGIDTTKINFLLTWFFILIQFIFIIIMGLSVNTGLFLSIFTFLIVSELLWSLFHVVKDFNLLENISRILMLCIGGVLIFLIAEKEINHINFPWTIILYSLIVLDCVNDFVKNKDNYISILKN